MPYLSVELDAKKKIPLVANALGLHPGIVAWGLLNLWEFAWLHRVEVVGELILSGCLGDPRLPELLEAYGFLERVPAGWTSALTSAPLVANGWRVRGAERYLRIRAAQSAGGHAAKGNLVPGGPQPSRSADPGLSLGSSPAPTSAGAGALHRAPSTEHREEDLEASSGGAPDASAAQVELVPTPTVDDLQAVWNSYPGLSRWLKSPPKRRAKASARLKERGLDGPEGWRTVIARVAASAFCRGEVGDRGWRANPDWLLAPDTAVKVLEGAYDDVPTAGRVRTGGAFGKPLADLGVGLSTYMPPKACQVCGAECEAGSYVGLCAQHREQWAASGRPAAEVFAWIRSKAGGAA